MSNYKTELKRRIIKKVSGRLTSFIRIGDEDDLEIVRAGGKKLNTVIDEKTHPSNRNCYVVVEEEDIFIDGESLSAVFATIVFLKKSMELEKWLLYHDAGKTYSYKEKKNLCCDNSFIIATDEAPDGITINTCTDGDYGIAYVWKNTMGMEITLMFDSEWYTDGGSIETPEEILDFLVTCLAKPRRERKREVYVSYTSDNEPEAMEYVKNVVKKCEDITFLSIETVSDDRACRNAYGKEMDEEEFDEIDPDSDEAWFDDYDFVFKVTISSALSNDDILEQLEENGVSADYEP